MTHMRLKLLVVGIAIAVAVVVLAISGAQQGGWVHYLAVDEFTAGTEYQDHRVRLHGHVAEEGFDAQGSLVTVHFELKGETTRIPVVFSDVLPDMFQVGAEVVVEGELDEAGVFQADILLTKCASKYESDTTPTQPGEHPSTGTAE